MTAAAFATPPPPPDPNAKGFYRIRADWAVDSDGDGRFDWQELLLDGNNPFNADSDGDGINDDERPEIPLAATPAAPERPPVAEFEHRYVVGAKSSVYFQHQAAEFGYAQRSDGQQWSEGNVQFDAMMLSNNFLELTYAAAGFPTESAWQTGVVSLEAINLTDYDSLGNIAETNWTNFKVEYRLKLPADAPEGGYGIPLTFAKLHYEWDDAANTWIPAAPPPGETITTTMTLVVEEGATSSPAVSLPLLDDVALNRRVVLVPADIAILEGDGSPPADGLCLQLGEGFKLDFNGTGREAHECQVPDDWITWQVRRLKADGGFEDWQTLLQPINQQPAKGCEVDASISEWFGCFQVRAMVSNGASDPIPLQALRMRDATHAVDRMGIKNPKLVAGQHEYLGVANCQKSEDVRNEAVKWLGSIEYARDGDVKVKPGYAYNPSLKGKNKCNIFVTHVANASGADTPYFHRHFGIVPTAPIARDDWYNSVEWNVDLDGPGWHYVGASESPTPGMVVASYGTVADGSGHCGILDYDGAWINAGRNSVNKSIHANHPNPDYQDYRMRMRLAP